MKQLLNLFFLLSFSASFSQNVAINNTGNTANATAILDVASTNKGILIPRMSEAQRVGIANPANGLLVYQTDGQQGFYFYNGSIATPTWVAISNANNTWLTSGNSLGTTASLGTISNSNIDLISNNIVRGRLSNLGEFFIGSTSTTNAGDLMAVTSNSSFPFAVNGYSSNNGAGVYGAITTGNTQFAGVQGDYQSSTAGIYNTAGVRGTNSSGIAGTGFRTLAATGPRAGVIGNTTATIGQYTFGIHGAMGSTDIRCGGVIGDDFGIALGTLAYYSASLNDYSVYGFGNAFQIGVVSGRASNPLSTPNTNIGLGIYGGIMGGWVRGLVYGAHVKGDRYSLYVDGKTYLNSPLVELVGNSDGSRTPVYGLTSEQPNLLASGKSTLINGSKYIAFSESFRNMANADKIVITITPLSNSKGLYIAEQDSTGFLVKENQDGKETINFSWMAIAERKGFDHVSHAPELLKNDFDKKMNNVMFNDNNTTESPQYIWWDGQNVRFDQPPVKKSDASYSPKLRNK